MTSILVRDTQGRFERQKRRRQCENVKTEAEAEVIHQQLTKAEQSKKENFSTFQNAGLQNCERIKFYCFKAPSWWQFVRAATRNQYNQ